jgi:hypothetical protein
MRKRNGTDGVKMRNGTDMELNREMERNGYGVKMRKGTDMGFKLSFNLIFVRFRILTPYPFRSVPRFNPISVPFRILTAYPFRSVF